MKLPKVTRREKALLYVLFLLVVVAGGWYVILQPQLSKNNKLKQKNQSLKTEHLTKQSSVGEFENLDLDNEVIRINEELKSIKEKFYAVTMEEDIDKLLTNLVRDYRMTPFSLSLGELEATEILAYKEEPKKNKEEVINSPILVMKVSQTVKIGSFNTSVGAYVEAINEIKGIYLDSITYADNQKEQATLIFTYTVYMYQE